MKLRDLGLLIIAAFMFVACEKEDGVTGNKAPANEISGSYTGYSLATFKYSAVPMVTGEEVVAVSENADGSVNLIYNSKQWGEFTVSSAKVSGSNDIYVVTGEGKTLMGMSGDSKKEYECLLNGTVNKKDNKVGFVFSVPSVMGGLNIEFYNGEMPDEYAVSGTYKGALRISVAGSEVGNIDDSQFTLTNNEGKLSLELKGFGFGNMQLEDINIYEVKCIKENDKYRISSEIDTVSGSIKVTGQLEGTIDGNGNADVVFIMKPGAMPMDITATFSGKKQ